MKTALKVKEVENRDRDYDRVRDVLYISFGTPIAADDAELLDNDIIVRYRGERVIGITVPDSSKKKRGKIKGKAGEEMTTKRVNVHQIMIGIPDEGADIKV